MDAIFEFLNQPIILTLVSLMIGSYLLSLVAERRSRRDRMKDQAIEFINDVAEHTNTFVVAVFEKLRTNRIVVDGSLEDAIRDLYSRRTSIEISSKAYLKSEKFYKEYFILMDGFGDVMGTFMRVDQGYPEDELIASVHQKCSQLEQTWPLPEERTTPDSDTLVDYLILWMDMINHRVTDLLTRYLEKVMRS